MKILFEHAYILTMDDSFTALKDGWLLTEGSAISALGEGKYEGECDERIDARGGILLPGFVNTHCHVSMVPFRTMGDDCADRLRRFLFPLEAEAMTPELVHLGAMYGIGEMLLAGITTFVDMYYYEDEVARACERTGIRGYVGETILDQPTCDSAKPYGGFAIQEALFSRYAGSDRVRPIVAPHSTMTCDAQALRRAYEMACAHDALMTLHISEMDYEMTHFAQRGQTPISYLNELGALDGRLLAAHCIHLTPEDIALMRRQGAGVAHCIGSNTKAGKGVAPVKALMEAGIPVSLGTDGPSSGNTLSMFDQMRLFADFHKTVNRDRSLFPAKEIVAAATRGGAQALHAQAEYGRLVPGMRADVVLVSTQDAHMFPVYNPYSALVYGACAADVDTVVANGVIRVRGGRLTDMDMPALRAELSAKMEPFMASAARYADII